MDILTCTFGSSFGKTETFLFFYSYYILFVLSLQQNSFIKCVLISVLAKKENDRKIGLRYNENTDSFDESRLYQGTWGYNNAEKEVK